MSNNRTTDVYYEWIAEIDETDTAHGLDDAFNTTHSINHSEVDIELDEYIANSYER